MGGINNNHSQYNIGQSLSHVQSQSQAQSQYQQRNQGNNSLSENGKGDNKIFIKDEDNDTTAIFGNYK